MRIKKYSKYISSIITRVLISLVIIMFSLIINKINPKVYLKIKKFTFNKSISFIKINKLSKKVIGKNVFYTENDRKTSKVANFNEISEKSAKYFDGEKLKVTNNLPIGAISSGVIIYIGKKENFNNTIIIQGVDNYNIWYGNIENVNYSLYDYVEKESLIGSCISDELYLLIEKDGKIYTYEEYKKYTSS